VIRDACGKIVITELRRGLSRALEACSRTLVSSHRARDPDQRIDAPYRARIHARLEQTTRRAQMKKRLLAIAEARVEQAQLLVDLRRLELACARDEPAVQANDLVTVRNAHVFIIIP
jgi:hypothetical protein